MRPVGDASREIANSETWQAALSRIAVVIEGQRSYAAIARKTGLHAESVRRYLQGARPPFDAGVAIIQASGLQLEHAVYGTRRATKAECSRRSLSDVALLDLLRELAARLSDAEDVVSLVSDARRESVGIGTSARATDGIASADTDAVELLSSTSQVVQRLLTAVERE